MSSSGAPTGTWDTLPPHLQNDASEIDIAALKARLKVQRPGVPEVEIPIDKNDFLIGRHPDEVDLVLDDEMVSRKHACLSVDARGYFKLVDLDTKNGIKFHGRTVRKLNLIDSDAFSIGKASFVFHAEMKRLPAASEPEQRGRADSVAEPPIPEPRACRDVADPGDD